MGPGHVTPTDGFDWAVPLSWELTAMRRSSCSSPARVTERGLGNVLSNQWWKNSARGRNGPKLWAKGVQKQPAFRASYPSSVVIKV
jgi:hypothetical protein